MGQGHTGPSPAGSGSMGEPLTHSSFDLHRKAEQEKQSQGSGRSHLTLVIPRRKVLRSKGEEMQRDPDLKRKVKEERVCRKPKLQKENEDE